MIVSIDTLPLETTEDCVVVGIPRNWYEIGSIPYRIKWHRDGLGSVIVRNIDNSVARTC